MDDNRFQERFDELNRQVAGLYDQQQFELALTITVNAKEGEKAFFLVEVVKAGIFQIRNVPEQDMEPILAVACPNILFPYVRETISDAINRAGFPPVILAPVNFESLYQQRLMEQQQSESKIQLQ